MRPELERFVEHTAEGMRESAIVMTLFSEKYKKGLDSLIQFSLAVMMDKPIFLLVPEGVEVPERLRRIADGIEFFRLEDKASLHEASRRLIAKAREQSLIE